MKIIAVCLNRECRPLLDKTYIDVENSNFIDYDLKLQGSMLIVNHKTRGSFAVPIQSVSWMKVEETKKGRPKKAQ